VHGHSNDRQWLDESTILCKPADDDYWNCFHVYRLTQFKAYSSSIKPSCIGEEEGSSDITCQVGQFFAICAK
jgi:hypothetical protein